jgi:hypothetical protein
MHGFKPVCSLWFIHSFIGFYASVMQWISERYTVIVLKRLCLYIDNDGLIDLSIFSIDGQRQTHWPIFFVRWRTTTEPLTCISRLLADTDRLIDLYFSSFSGQRQTYRPIYLLYWRTTTDPWAYFLDYWRTTTYALTYYSLHLDKAVG